MSLYKGKLVKNKSKLRQEKKVLEEVSRQEGNPLKEIMIYTSERGIQEIDNGVKKLYKLDNNIRGF